MPIKFLASHNTIIFGPTGIEKTQFMLEVIRQKLVDLSMLGAMIWGALLVAAGLLSTCVDFC